MSFALSKIIWALIAPGGILCLACIGGFLLFRRAPRLARGLIGFAAVVTIALLTLPLSNWALAPLEQRFPQPTLPADVTGIIVLGGSVDARASRKTGQPVITNAPERLIRFVELARRYPKAQLVFSGGSSLLSDQRDREATWTRKVFEQPGLDPKRITFESNSRNTWENALYSKRLVHPKPGQTWVLIASAWHMPRSVGCFRAAGWQVIPFPVGYREYVSGWFDFSMPDQLTGLTNAIHEWVGLVAYRLLGRSPSLFPAPRSTGGQTST